MNHVPRQHRTLPEVLIMVAIGATILAILVSAAFRLHPGQQKSATEDARVWASQMGLPTDHIVCSDADLDGDGYVSCAVSTGDRVIPVECRSMLLPGHGCRIPKATVRGAGGVGF